MNEDGPRKETLDEYGFSEGVRGKYAERQATRSALTQVPDFLDNGDPKTYQVLDHYLREEPRADFASGYFNLGG